MESALVGFYVLVLCVYVFLKTVVRQHKCSCVIGLRFFFIKGCEMFCFIWEVNWVEIILLDVYYYFDRIKHVLKKVKCLYCLEMI